jgi:hypothetical protein
MLTAAKTSSSDTYHDRHQSSSIPAKCSSSCNLTQALQLHHHCREAIINGNYKKLNDLLKRKHVHINHSLDHAALRDNYKGYSLVDIAIAKSRLDILKLLIENGAAKSLFRVKESGTSLHSAILSKNREIVEYILQFNDSFGPAYNPLHSSCNILYMKSHFLKMNPLQIAINLRVLRIISLLFAYGAHLNMKSSERANLQLTLSNDSLLWDSYWEGEKLLLRKQVRLFCFALKRSKEWRENGQNCVRYKDPTIYRYFVSHRLFDINLLGLIFDFLRPAFTKSALKRQQDIQITED